MENSVIEIKIDENGEVTLHVQGVTGMQCKDITAQLEALLGGEFETEFTPEAFEEDALGYAGMVGNVAS